MAVGWNDGVIYAYKPLMYNDMKQIEVALQV